MTIKAKDGKIGVAYSFTRRQEERLMSMLEQVQNINQDPGIKGLSRRRFLEVGLALGAGVGLNAFLSACGPDGQPISQDPSATVASEATATSVSTVESSPTPEKDPFTLREIAEKIDFKIGTQGASTYVKLGQQIASHFNTLTLTDLKMTNPWGIPPLRPDRNTFNFQDPDITANYARRNKMEMQGLHLVWGTAVGGFIPEWVYNLRSREEAISAMTDHVQGVMKHYPDIKLWSVVNEPYLHQNRPDVWQSKIGDDYPFIAAKAARDVDPRTILIVNDADNETINARQSNANYDLARKLAAEGLIDGMGFQMHLYPPFPKKDEVKRNFERFANLNNGQFKNIVTEFDVNIHNVPGTQEERWQAQAKVGKDMLEASLESNVLSFSTFGYNDPRSWLNQWFPNSEPTLFDKDGNLKPIYLAMQEVLRSRLPSK